MLNFKKLFIKPPYKKSKKVERVIYFFIAPLLLLCAMELMHITYTGSAEKIFASPFYPVKLIITYLYLLSFQLFFYFITFGSDIFANILNSVFFIFAAYANEVVAKITGDPLLPTDLLLINSLKNISGFAKIPIYPSMIGSILIIAYSVKRHFTVCKRNEKPVRSWNRIPAVILSFCIFAVSSYYMCINYQFRHKILKCVDVEMQAFNPIEDYNANGFVLTFFPRIGDIFIEVPPEYSEERINEIKEEYGDLKIDAKENAVHPNIIIIQNEAFWDPTLMENVKFSADPMPNIRKLQKKYYGGYMFSSVFAGGTCMPEFECISGMSSAFLDVSTYPYIQHVTKETPSIVSEYKKAGYSTVAIHPYKKNFYGRQTAYPLLGFDKFIGADDMEEPEIGGFYVSDKSAFDCIIKEYENKSTERIYEFCVTMQNHGAYENKRYEEYDIDILNCPLSQKDKEGLLEYTQGVYEADKAFSYLVDYFKNQKEPTIILMYGDHLPLLGTDGSTYQDSGFVEKEKVFEYYKYPQLYETPYVIWSNYKLKRFKIPKITSSANLGLNLLKQSNIGMPWYYGLFMDLYNKYPVYQRKYKMNKKFEILDDVENEDKKEEYFCQLVQYDILDGKKYSLKF